MREEMSTNRRGSFVERGGGARLDQSLPFLLSPIILLRLALFPRLSFRARQPPADAAVL